MSEDALLAQRLRRRIRIERKVSTRDAMGGESVSYALRAAVYAEKRDIIGREALIAQQFAPLAQLSFLIRYRTDVVESDRIVFKGKPYDIQHIGEVGRNVGLRILVKQPGAAESTDP